jgi:hypothetical protein
MRDKTLILLVCFIGIAGVCYGMVNNDRVVFVTALVVVVLGYLMIRKKLKAYIKGKYPSSEDKQRKAGGPDPTP